MRRWRHPSLSIHGVHGAFAEPGEKTVIPAKGEIHLNSILMLTSF